MSSMTSVTYIGTLLGGEAICNTAYKGMEHSYLQSGEFYIGVNGTWTFNYVTG